MRELSSSIPGTGAGDNVGFLWNLWWFRTVRQSADLHYLQCPYLFAPFGTSLVLHTALPLQSFIGATLLSGVPLVTAHNLLLLTALTANGLATYALAFSQARESLAAALAGTIVASSSYVGIHLLGHVNLVNVWVLSVGALVWIRFLAAPSLVRAFLVALSLAAATYSDYYYLIYLAVFDLVWWFAQVRWVAVRRRERRHPALEGGTLLLLALVGVFTVAIATSGGFQISIAGLRITAFNVRNPVTGIWLLGLCWILLRFRIVLTRAPEASAARFQTLAPLVGAAAVTYLALISPIAVEAVRVVSSGDYVSQRYFWRSAPRGIDLLTLVTGNPLNSAYGAAVRGLFDRLHINLMEQTAWIGLAPLAVGLMMLARGLRPRTTMTRAWALVGILLFIWSAGPFAVIGGADTGALLPQLVARYVPFVANARIPGRAFIVVQLAVAVLCALAVTRIRLSHAAVLGLCALTVADGIAVPYPLYEIRGAGPIERALSGDRAPGSVLELPVGLLDGFGQTGRFDFRAMEHQIAHGRPIVGGAISRIAPRIMNAYRDWPAAAALMNLSADPSANRVSALPQSLEADLAQRGVRYVVVNRDVMPLPRDTLTRLGLIFVQADAGRELYRVDADR